MSFKYNNHFRQGKINIYQADCMDLLCDTPDGYYDLAIVDCPYGISIDESMAKDSNTERGKSEHKRGNYIAKKWDKEPPPPEFFKELFRVSKNQIIWGANHFIERINKNSSCWIVWDKDNGNNGYADCELAWTSFPTAVRKVKIKWHGMLQGDMKNKEDRIHPTQKPAKLFQFILENYSKPTDKVLDTHGGSFNSAIAAHYYGCELDCTEIDYDYFNVGIDRFKKKTIQLKIDN